MCLVKLSLLIVKLVIIGATKEEKQEVSETRVTNRVGFTTNLEVITIHVKMIDHHLEEKKWKFQLLSVADL